MIDLEKLKLVYNFGKNINLSDVQDLIKAAKLKTFGPSEYLIEARDVRKNIFLIRNGLVRAFQINHRGEEITTSLFWENQIVANPDMIFFNQACRSYFQALEPTNVLHLDYDILEDIVSRNPKLEANRKFVFQSHMRRAIQRIDSFVLLSPEERYIQFIETNPDIIDRVHNKYIANILGITPVSLSRIRKRIASRKK